MHIVKIASSHRFLICINPWGCPLVPDGPVSGAKPVCDLTGVLLHGRDTGEG
jgi:hypothetical protein